MSLNLRIKKALKASRVNHEDLAKRLGLHRVTVTRNLSSDAKKDWDSLEAVIAVHELTGTTLNWLIKEEGEMYFEGKKSLKQWLIEEQNQGYVDAQDLASIFDSTFDRIFGQLIQSRIGEVLQASNVQNLDFDYELLKGLRENYRMGKKIDQDILKVVIREDEAGNIDRYIAELNKRQQAQTKEWVLKNADTVIKWLRDPLDLDKQIREISNDTETE